MKKNNLTNTTERAIGNPLLGLLDALNIPATEQRGQSELVNSTQLPSIWGYNKPRSLKEQYELMGIKVIGETQGDKLFLDVILPEGWKKKPTSHHMYTELLDDKERVRATICYKSAFYDRDAHITFNTRYNADITSTLPSEQRGHYEMQDVQRYNPNYTPPKGKKDSEEYEIMFDQNGYSRAYYHRREPKYIVSPEQVWIPKFKNKYDEYNATPHYFELTDSGKVFFTTQDDPIFFKRKYRKKTAEKWLNDYDHIINRTRTIAYNTLLEKYPDWKNINAYWD